MLDKHGTKPQALMKVERRLKSLARLKRVALLLQGIGAVLQQAGFPVGGTALIAVGLILAGLLTYND